MTNTASNTYHLNPISPEQTIYALDQDFEYLSTAADAYTAPDQLDASHHFQPAIVPGTVSMLLDSDEQRRTLDTQDHWYRTRFTSPKKPYQKAWLHFDGLLTKADVYLNGNLILQSENAFHRHRIDVTEHLESSNALYICFRAIHPIYTARHPRARYITRLVNERHLRFIRTPVLGYTPGFSSANKLVGPYRPITLTTENTVSIISSEIKPKLQGKDTGLIDTTFILECLSPKQPTEAWLTLFDEEDHQEISRASLDLTQSSNHQLTTSGQLIAQQIAPYWPRTHGKPSRYLLTLTLKTEESEYTLTIGKYGFREIKRIDTEAFTLNYNGATLYLRGACWTPMEPERLFTEASALRHRLVLLRDAGINMLRIPGNMPYETDAFYALCDELGILIYQDFAFTNFDYPETDEFNNSITKEVTDFLQQHGARPCLTVLCGGSEVAQQAAMMGAKREDVDHPLFTQTLPDIIKALTPDIPYVISSPYNSNGMPFHVGDGPSQYFGVGGYLRSFEDARLFKGRFITECLPFSHPPEDESLRQFWGGEIMPPNHPLWKDGVTRDPGSGWDFSDITDHYVEQLFCVDATKLRTTDQQRYLDFCRATLTEAVETVLSIFRADSASGRTALVWNLHDLKPGAGWGYIDILGKPKSAFYGLARTAQPTTVLFVDEGLEGQAVYLAHDGKKALENCSLKVSLVTAEGKIFAENAITVSMQPRSVNRYSVDTVIGRFVDSSYAYRFGPRAFLSTVAQLYDQHGELICQKITCPSEETQHVNHQVALTAEATPSANGKYQLTISSQAPAYYVNIAVNRYQPSDNYFHVLPGFDKTIWLMPQENATPLTGRLRALNSTKSFAIKTLTA